jgi:hypothetical protein
MNEQINIPHQESNEYENKLLELIFDSVCTDNVLLQRYFIELLHIGTYS